MREDPLAKIFHNDTIAALATPVGEGAIAVIRVSGPQAISILDTIFVGKSRLTESKGFRVYFGRIRDSAGDEVDEVLCTVFRNPNSYTGEDSVEVGCHGGMYVAKRVLGTILKAGARYAEAGEFTKRAFLNGKMDLSQAEAVASLISAKSESALRASLKQLEGMFSGRVRVLRSQLLDLGSLIELELDFSDEGVDLMPKSDVVRRIEVVIDEIQTMIDSYSQGRLFRDGVTVAIIGKPNAGKSSIFNALLRNNRAIVNDIPGTTRDTLEENVFISGVLYRLIDTAGIHDTKDAVESEGVDRAVSTATQADIKLLVIDASQGIDRESARGLLEQFGQHSPTLIAYNKVDVFVRGELPSVNEANSFHREVLVSARTGFGLEELSRELTEIACGGLSSPEALHVINSRHYSALTSTLESLKMAVEGLHLSTSGEFIALDIRAAADSLGEIVGEITSEEMLNNIFSKFCIGK